MTIAVIGATGQQGSAVVNALLALDAPVRAAVRDPGAKPASDLAKRGIDVVAADLDDPASLRAAFEGASAAFAMTTYSGPEGTDGEIAHGRALADAVEAAALPHLVYSSVGGAERNTGIPHFESKRRIEEFLLDTGTRVAFLRPTFFMDNLIRMIDVEAKPARIALPLPDGVPLQMISVRDIGKAAAALLLNRDDAPQSLEIAGDEITGSQIADIVAAQLGVPARYVEAPLDVLGDDEDRKSMFRWFTDLPAYRADFADTRRWVPDAEDLAAWMRRSVATPASIWE
ncbi:NmrA/HSCARG family protein [Mycobacterium sp. NPDC048908]|uniref:NmrA/HSCARG family protein n=1 Tax=Mycobacterium sp. NPDC048908 TaxID=3364292 RepID=UPI00370FF363